MDTVSVADKQAKYAGTSADVMVKGSILSVVNNQITLNPAKGEDNAANVVKNITQVEVTNPTGEAFTYFPAQTGKVNHYVAKLFDENGAFQANATCDFVEATVSGKKATYKVVTSGAVFATAGTYSINVTATGYEKLVFQYENKIETPATQTPNTTQTPAPATTTATPSAVTATPGAATATPAGATATPDIAGAKKTANGITYKAVKDSKGNYSATVTAAKKKTIKAVTIPATVKIEGQTLKVTKIANNAFKNCKKVTKITTGKNVKTIGKQAFYGNKAVKKITIKSTKITSIGTKAFAKGNKKAKLTVPASKKKAYKKLVNKAGFQGTVK